MYAGIVPFALLSASVDPDADWDLFSSIATVLPRSIKGEPDLELLQGSRNWELFRSMSDLLAAYEADLEAYASNGQLLTNADTVREIILDLRRQRGDG